MSEEIGTPVQTLETGVLDELGGDRLQEIAALLGTDEAGAQDLIGTAVSALSAEVSGVAVAPPPEEEPTVPAAGSVGGFPTGVFATGGLMTGVLAKAAQPVAEALSEKAGISAPTASRVVDKVIPAIVAVLSGRAARK